MSMSDLDIQFQELNNAIKYGVGDVQAHYQMIFDSYPQMKRDDLIAMFDKWQPTCVSCLDQFQRDLVNKDYVCHACLQDNCYNCGYQFEAVSLDAVNGFCQNCANAYDKGFVMGYEFRPSPISHLRCGEISRDDGAEFGLARGFHTARVVQSTVRQLCKLVGDLTYIPQRGQVVRFLTVDAKLIGELILPNLFQPGKHFRPSIQCPQHQPQHGHGPIRPSSTCAIRIVARTTIHLRSHPEPIRQLPGRSQVVEDSAAIVQRIERRHIIVVIGRRIIVRPRSVVGIVGIAEAAATGNIGGPG